MNRIINFKVWDKQNNCWYEPTYEAYKGNLEELLITPRGQLNMRKMHDGVISLYGDSNFPDRFELLQFTGLHDKSGKEAYHKDIVRMAIFLYTIEWDKKATKFYLKSANDLDNRKYSIKHLNKHGEIIGSIFTHKHLLEAAE